MEMCISIIVALKNLNYDKVSTPYGDEIGVDNGVESNTRSILSAIVEQTEITQKNLALKTGVSIRTVSRQIRILRDSGVMRRIGSDRSGRWEIIKP